jgi:hypothetical protein
MSETAANTLVSMANTLRRESRAIFARFVGIGEKILSKVTGENFGL